MFQGLRTAIYAVSDLQQARQWYAKALGKEPYYDGAPYVGFNVGGFELGLLAAPKETPTPLSPGGVVAYWGVQDIRAQVERLLEIGAKEHAPVSDVGDGILVATVLDPFGNPLGLIHNPHFPNTE